jgi:DNA-directed RNA polymerase subunit H (RpoH/RPB5)
LPGGSDIGGGELALVEARLRLLFGYRGWTMRTPALVERRRDFRAFASSESVRAVALFGDFSTEERRKGSSSAAEPARVMPTASALQWAVERADDDSLAEFGAGAEAKTLVVLVLRSDAKSSALYAEAQAFVDSLTLVPARASVCYVEVWHTQQQLAIDVLGHVLVGPHRLERKYTRHPLAQLPLIRLADPVVHWLGGHVDDVIVETRNEPDSGESLYARRVVA